MACKAMALKPAQDIVTPTQKEFVIDTNALVLYDAVTIAIGHAQAVVAVTANGALDQVTRRRLYNCACGSVKSPMLARVHLVFARCMRALARLGMAIEGNAG